MLTPAELARLEELETKVARLSPWVQEIQAAQRNRAMGVGAATTAGQATITAIGAAKLIAAATGLFWGSVSFSYASAAATDVPVVTLQTATDNVAGTPLTLTNAAAIGPGTSGIALPGNTAVANNGSFTSNAGAGITLTGATAPVTIYTTTQTIGTAAVGMTFSWSGFIRLANSSTLPSPFALGSTALLLLNVTNSAARATGNISMQMFEIA